jgi:hypothetical protein
VAGVNSSAPEPPDISDSVAGLRAVAGLCSRKRAACALGLAMRVVSDGRRTGDWVDAGAGAAGAGAMAVDGSLITPNR